VNGTGNDPAGTGIICEEVFLLRGVDVATWRCVTVVAAAIGMCWDVVMRYLRSWVVSRFSQKKEYSKRIKMAFRHRTLITHHPQSSILNPHQSGRFHHFFRSTYEP
jgi:hypothetical protein